MLGNRTVRAVLVGSWPRAVQARRVTNNSRVGSPLWGWRMCRRLQTSSSAHGGQQYASRGYSSPNLSASLHMPSLGASLHASGRGLAMATNGGHAYAYTPQVSAGGAPAGGYAYSSRGQQMGGASAYVYDAGGGGSAPLGPMLGGSMSRSRDYGGFTGKEEYA